VIDAGPVGGGGVVVEVPNTASTLRGALIDTLHAPVPLQAPLQPRKVEPVVGVAVSETVADDAKLALQVVPQLIPAGELVTVPAPPPLFVTVSAFWDAVKFAVAFSTELTVSVQVEVPEQAPLQPAKVEPALGVAVSVTTEPEVKLLVQVAPQLRPLGEEVTTPLPVPVLAMVIDGKAVANVAVTLLAVLMETLHDVAVPVQAPLQPLNVEPALGVAVRLTVVPCAYVALQVAPQLMPVGELPTTPAPVPARLTVSVCAGPSQFRIPALKATSKRP